MKKQSFRQSGTLAYAMKKHLLPTGFSFFLILAGIAPILRIAYEGVQELGNENYHGILIIAVIMILAGIGKLYYMTRGRIIVTIKDDVVYVPKTIYYETKKNNSFELHIPGRENPYETTEYFIYFTKNNVSKAYATPRSIPEINSEVNKIMWTHVYDANNIVCIEFKNPLKEYFEAFPNEKVETKIKLNKIYVSVQQPEQLIMALKQ